LSPPTAVAAAIVVAAPNTAAADRVTDRADRARRAAIDIPVPAAQPALAVQPLLEHATVPRAANPHAASPRRVVPRRVTVIRRQVRPAQTTAWAAPANASRASTVIAFALAQVGKPYVWAAAGPGGYDCSGLVLAAYARVGIRLPHQTGGIIGYGRHVTRSQLQPGDIVFPQSGHVAVYLGNNMIVHAPHSGDHVRVASLYGFYSAVRLL
jgi:peptidoglycan DL-endopeptidase CwlO